MEQAEGRGRRRSVVLLSATEAKGEPEIDGYSRRRLRLVEESRPRTRGDCAEGRRPCPFVSCRHHLYLEVQPSGAILVNFPALEPHQLKRSCSLDEADLGPKSLREVGRRMNMSFECVRGIEGDAIRSVKDHADDLPSADDWIAEPSGPLELDAED